MYLLLPGLVPPETTERPCKSMATDFPEAARCCQPSWADMAYTYVLCWLATVMACEGHHLRNSGVKANFWLINLGTWSFRKPGMREWIAVQAITAHLLLYFWLCCSEDSVMAKPILLSHSWPLDLISWSVTPKSISSNFHCAPCILLSYSLTKLPSLLVFKPLWTKNHPQGQTGWQFLRLCKHTSSFLSKCLYPLQFVILKLKQNIWEPLLRKPCTEITILQLCAVESSYMPFPSIVTSHLAFSARSHPHMCSPVQPQLGTRGCMQQPRGAGF